MAKIMCLPSDWGAGSFMCGTKAFRLQETAFVLVSGDLVFLFLAKVLNPTKFTIMRNSFLAGPQRVAQRTEWGTVTGLQAKRQRG